VITPISDHPRVNAKLLPTETIRLGKINHICTRRSSLQKEVHDQFDSAAAAWRSFAPQAKAQ